MLDLPAVLAHGSTPVVPGTPSWGNVLHPLVVLVLAVFVVATNHRTLNVRRPDWLQRFELPTWLRSASRLVLAVLTVAVLQLTLGARRLDPFNTGTQLIQLFWYALTLLSIVFASSWSTCAPWLAFSKWRPSAEVVGRPIVGSVLLIALNFGYIAYLTTSSTHLLGLTLCAYGVVMVGARLLRGPEFAYSIDPIATYAGVLGRRSVTFASAVVVFATFAYRVLSDHTGWLTWSSSTSQFETFTKRSLTLIALVIAVALICTVGGRVVSYCSGASLHTASMWFVQSLVPIAIALFLAHDLFPFATMLQEQVAVLFDPLDRGWSATQGVQVNLARSYLGVIEIAALIIGPVLAAWTAQRQVSGLGQHQTTFAVMPIYFVIAVLGYSMAKVLIPF